MINRLRLAAEWLPAVLPAVIVIAILSVVLSGIAKLLTPSPIAAAPQAQEAPAVCMLADGRPAFMSAVSDGNGRLVVAYMDVAGKIEAKTLIVGSWRFENPGWTIDLPGAVCKGNGQ